MEIKAAVIISLFVLAAQGQLQTSEERFACLFDQSQATTQTTEVCQGEGIETNLFRSPQDPPPGVSLVAT